MKKLTSIIITSFLAFICVYSVANAYTVVLGDTMWKIAQNAGIGLTELVNNNPQVKNPNLIYPGQEINIDAQLGATLPIAGNTYNLAGSGITGSATSITLQSFTIKQTGQKILDADLSDTFYITLEPGNNKKQEIASCTTVTQNAGGTATLSGCSRGLSPIYPYTASTTLQFSHAGGTQVIFSDAPQLFNEYVSKGNAESITGVKTFYSFPVYATSTDLPTTNGQFATKYYVDQVGAGGFTSANVSTTRGLSVDGSSPEKVGINASSTTGMAFDSSGKLYQKVSTTAGLYSDSNGIGINYASNNTWTGTNTINGTTTLATTTISNISLPYNISSLSLLAGKSLSALSAVALVASSSNSTTTVSSASGGTFNNLCSAGACGGGPHAIGYVFTNLASSTASAKVSFSLKKNGTGGGNFTLTLYTVDGSNKPVLALGTAIIDGTAISASGAEYFYDFKEVTLDPSTNYAVAIRYRDSDATNNIAVSCSGSSQCNLIQNDADTWTYNGSYTTYNHVYGYLISNYYLDYASSTSYLNQRKRVIGINTENCVFGNNCKIATFGAITGLNLPFFAGTVYLSDSQEGLLTNSGTYKLGYAYTTSTMIIIRDNQ